MPNRNVGRTIGIAAAMAAAAMLQGCAVTTGRYVPDRSSNSNHSMLSRYDARFQRIQSYSTPATGMSLHVPQPRSYSRYLFSY